MKARYVFLIVACFASGYGLAQNVDKIFADFFSTTGGIDARTGMKSILTTGTAYTPRGEFPITLYNKRPNFLKVVLDVEGKKYIAQAFDGSTAWGLNPFQGGNEAEKLPKAQAENVAQEANFEEAYLYARFTNYRDKGYIATLEGKETVGERECFKVKMTLDSKDELHELYYFDTEAKYLLKYTVTGVSNGKRWERHQHYNDYREVNGGLKMPFYQEFRFNSTVIRKLIVKKIVINEELDDKIFAYPQ